jgi:hypothetical protein
MASSPAQIEANRRNAQLSTGPRSTEGKERSRRNALKHGLTGEGVALPNEDADEVESRFESFREEFRPSSEFGETLVRRAAILSVRLDRSVSHETAALSTRIRQADANFVAPDGADPATVAQLKAEARALTMFDSSKEATLARRYEAAAERGLYRAIKEFHEVEKQARAEAEKAESESFDRVMGSFFQLEERVEKFEVRHAEQAGSGAKPSPRPLETSFPQPLGAGVDVPITIGKRR